MDKEERRHSYFLRAKAPRFPGEDSPAPSEEEDLANCLVMLSNKASDAAKGKEVVSDKAMFQCKACKKVFSSHQALGGHRASHKKVKGCFASKIDGPQGDEDDEQEPFIPSEPAAARKGAKMHECSVCRRVFSSGQALGGHKRCHWLTTSTDNAFIPSFRDFRYDHQSQQLCNKPMIVTNPNDHHHRHHNQDDRDHQLHLNLNLPPAPQHDLHEASTRLCLQQWAKDGHEKMDGNGLMKVRKLSEMRDVNLDGGWLQMGIASTTEIMR